MRAPAVLTLAHRSTPRMTRCTVRRTGEGIPIRKQEMTIKDRKQNIYIPEMIFGHLLTSSNYNDSQQRGTLCATRPTATSTPLLPPLLPCFKTTTNVVGW